MTYYFTADQIRKARTIRIRRANMLSQIRGIRDSIEEVRAKAALKIADGEKRIADIRRGIWALQQNECDHPNQAHEPGKPVTHCTYCGLGTEPNGHS